MSATTSRRIVAATPLLFVPMGLAGCGSEQAADTGSAAGASSAAAPSDAESAAPPAGLPGGQIAYRRFDEDQTTAALFVMSSDGSGIRQVTQPGEAEIDNMPDWSPDGTKLAYERSFPSKPYEVWTVNADGSAQHVVDPGCPSTRPDGPICEEVAPDWSPDGKRLLFSWPAGNDVNGVIEMHGLGVMDADGRNAEQISNLEMPTTYEDMEPVWSPDATQIAFVRWNITDEPRDATAVFVRDAAGTREKQITPWELRASDISWSPDGTALSFRSEPDMTAHFVGDLYTVAPDGSELTEVTDHEPGTMTLGSSWSPDSEWIVFASTGVAGQPDIYVMRRDGSELTPLTRTPVWDSAPAWSPNE